MGQSFRTLCTALAMGGLLVTAVGTVAAQGTSFTYQGRLMEGGAPVDGAVDAQFRLYDAAVEGATVGLPLTFDDLAVSGGLFSVTLDFGPHAFNGQPRWLEIALDAEQDESFDTLSPRTAILPTPYAMQATTSVALRSPNGSLQNVVITDDNGQVAMGQGAVINDRQLTIGGDGSIEASSIGTSDVHSFEIIHNNKPALRVEPGSGTPNIIGGSEHNYAFGFGSSMPTVSGATIAGGGFGLNETFLPNRVREDYGTVSGGLDNEAAGYAAIVGGGESNTARGYHSAVVGGELNTAGDYNAFLGGGWRNMVDGFASSIVGGRDNTIEYSEESFIGGGSGNSVSGSRNFIGGGVENQISEFGHVSVIGGGNRNKASEVLAVIGGGDSNEAAGTLATIAGGARNRILQDGTYAFIGGGEENESYAPWSVIVGGRANATYGLASAIGGGTHNVAGGENATIAGGFTNEAGGWYSFIGGGQENQALGTNDVIGGGLDNYSEGGYNVIGGGVYNQIGGLNPGDGSTIGGGWSNYAENHSSTVGGGSGNRATGDGSTVAGGWGNVASGTVSMVSGGEENEAIGDYSVAGGGVANKAIGDYSISAGGALNEAAGDFSFAAGYQARALHEGTFVWSSVEAGFDSTHDFEFAARATGGFRFVTNVDEIATGATLPAGEGSWVSLSDVAAKEDIETANSREVLNALLAMPVSTWRYKGADARHMGPTAQDFHAAFGLNGDNDKGISTVDIGGVAFAGIQGLHAQMREENARLQRENEDLRANQAAMLARLEKLEAILEAK